MIIDSSAIQSGSSHSKIQADYQSISAGGSRGGSSVAVGAPAVSQDGSLYDVFLLSDAGRQSLQFFSEQGSSSSFSASQSSSASVSGAREVADVGVVHSKEELTLKLLEMFMSRLSGGGKFSFKQVSEEMMMQRRQQRILGFQGMGGRANNSISGLVNNGRDGFSITATQAHYERESVSYSAQGVVKTADGRTINLDLQMNMSREFAEYSQSQLNWRPPQNQVVKDPLVINYAGSASSLTQEKYEFDIDSDGDMENISFAGPGSGFLALDKDSDGTIDDGGELFGPGTGNGFGELRAYDKDGNGWIDEADGVYDDLRIWSKDDSGKDQLFTLQELGVGAIYLGDVSTEFTMTDAANNTQGIMRSTSFFLKEDGSGAGTVSHIDLRV